MPVAPTNNGNVNVAAVQPTREAGIDKHPNMTAEGMLADAMAELDATSPAPKVAIPADAEPEVALDDVEDGDDEIEVPGEEDEVAEETAPQPDTEEITVTDGDGQKTITIDYSDRAAIKRAFEKNAGLDKLFSRYKQVRSELAEVKAAGSSKSDKEAQMDTLSTAFGDGGPLGALQLLDVLTQGKGLDLAKQIAGQAAPTAGAAAGKPEAIPEAAALRSELAAMKAENRYTRAQAVVDGVFPEFSFVGKLGNPAREQELDDLVFTKFQASMAKAEAAGQQLTTESARVMFSSAAKLIPQAIHQEARRLAKKGKDEVSQRAKKAAQSAAVKGSTGAASAPELKDEDINWLNPNDITRYLEKGLASK